MKQARISEAVVRRLPVYLRFLNELAKAGVQTVSSQELGERLSLNPAQIRKDLAYFGEFGRKGIGYNVPYLIEKIRQILHLDRTVHAALVGTGNLGRALCNYRVYLQENVKIVALFDADPRIIGTTINRLKVQPMEELAETVRERSIAIGMIAVPASEAQLVADRFAAAGVRGILNFAPTVLKTPPGVRVHYADFTAELYSLAYYMEEDFREEDAFKETASNEETGTGQTGK